MSTQGFTLPAIKWNPAETLSNHHVKLFWGFDILRKNCQHFLHRSIIAPFRIVMAKAWLSIAAKRAHTPYSLSPFHLCVPLPKSTGRQTAGRVTLHRPTDLNTTHSHKKIKSTELDAQRTLHRPTDLNTTHTQSQEDKEYRIRRTEKYTRTLHGPTWVKCRALQRHPSPRATPLTLSEGLPCYLLSVAQTLLLQPSSTGILFSKQIN